MIVFVDSEEKCFTRSGGCSCCDTDLYLETDHEEILKELKRNIDVVKESCKVLNIDFLEFVCS